MQTDKSSHSTSAAGAVPPASAPALSDDALARRRMLMKSLGKGAAVVAVAAPIQALASGRLPGTNKLCTVSGSMSAVGSAIPGTSNDCSGYAPSYYGAPPTNWPSGVDSTTPFASIFSPSSPPGPTLAEVLAGGSDDAVWVTAYLNASKEGVGGPVLNFPYSPSEVVAFYNSAEPARSQALVFFQTYIQGRL